MDDPVPAPMSQGRYRLLLGVLLAGAVVALVAAVRATDTEDASSPTSDVVERFVPKAGDEVLRQAELGADLAPGYEGTILLNGVEIPEDEQRRVPEQNQVFFTPGEGKVVERLHAGRNCAVVLAWKTADGRGTARDKSFTWCFEAT
jgi:hypothetical protein